MGRTIPEREEVRAWEAGLRALAYLKGLLGSVERKNGWSAAGGAEYAGDATPDGVSAAGG